VEGFNSFLCDHVRRTSILQSEGWKIFKQVFMDCKLLDGDSLGVAAAYSWQGGNTFQWLDILLLK